MNLMLCVFQEFAYEDKSFSEQFYPGGLQT